MKSFTFAVFTSAAAISADELEFVHYTARFNKIYADMEEYTVRLERFKHNHKLINEHNNSNGSKNFTLGHNQFSDWSDAEYEAILGYIPGGTVEKGNGNVEVFD